MKLWDFNDPAQSERRFREAAATLSGDDRAAHLTQVARALGLQDKYAEGLQVLDGVADGGAPVRIHVALEHGRLLRSMGRPAEALADFVEAERLAKAGGRDDLRIDAMHMIALTADPEDQLTVKRAALNLARASDDHRARDWDAALLTNIGMTHAEAGDHEQLWRSSRRRSPPANGSATSRRSRSPGGWSPGRSATSAGTARR